MVQSKDIYDMYYYASINVGLFSILFLKKYFKE